MWTPPLPEHRSSGRDEVEDLLGKGHDQAARKGEKTLGTLGGVMALEGEAHLHHAPAQQNQADGTDQGKDEGGEIVHYRQRIAGSEGSGRKAADAQHGSYIGGKPVTALSAKGQGALGLVVLLVVIFLGNPMMQNILQKHSSNSLCSLRLQKVLRIQQFEILVLLRRIVQIVCGVLRQGVIIGRGAAIFRELDVGVAHQVVLIVQHGALPTDEQNRLAVVQHPHLIGGEQFPARLLVVDAEAAASPTAVAVGVGIQRFLAHELGNILVGLLFIAAQVEKLVAQPHQGLPLLLEQRLDLRHVLSDVAAEYGTASHGGEPGQEVVRRQGDVGRFIDEEMDRHR